MTSRRCLLCDAELGENTTTEHAIPRAIGGRIRSRRTTCSECNNDTSHGWDDEFTGAYLPIMQVLDVLLSSEHRPPPLYFRDGEDRYAMQNGEFRWLNLRILHRDTEGRPREWSGDPEKAECLVHQLGFDPSKVRRGPCAPLAHGGTLESAKGVLTVSPRMDVAALKAFLVAFDATMSAPASFPRCDALAGVRGFIRRCVVEGDVPADDLERYVLGLAHEERIDDWLDRVRALVPVEVSEFEHLLVVWSNPATRAVEGMWRVLGIDTWQFRLSTSWRDGPFCFALVNGVLKNTSSTEEPVTVTVPPPDTLRRSPFASLGPDRADGAAQVDVFARSIAERRSLAMSQAAELVERTEDDVAWKALVRGTSLVTREQGGEASLSDGIIRRVKAIYARVGAEELAAIDADLQQIAQVAAGELSMGPEDDVDGAQFQEPSAVGLAAYRLALSAAADRFGPRRRFITLRTETKEA